MIETLNPYSSTAKTAKIMSRYRPIAPRPDHSPSNISQKLNQTADNTRNQWFQLQARPGTRTKKRGRSSSETILPTTFKRPKIHIAKFTENIISLHSGFNISALSQSRAVNTSLVTLPLLPCQPYINEEDHKEIDLNTAAEIPEEKDLLRQLQDRPSSNVVIAPQPVRPVGSSIKVGCMSEEYPSLMSAVNYAGVNKKREEVEKEVESDALPAVISDSNNKVRMANSAYKEMVGQPECSWLDSMVMGDGRLGCSSCKRISGEVMLQFSDSVVPVSSNGFSCWVRIEWGSDGNRNSINAFCDVNRLRCESKDYVFTWRFHTRSREASQSNCNV